MKFRIALVAVLAAGLAAALAVTAPAQGQKANTETTTTTPGNVCHPNAWLVLKGKLVAVAGDQLSFTMDVTQASRLPRLYRGQTVTVQVSATTKIWRLGQKVAPGGLTAGDRLVVQMRICRMSNDTTVTPIAVRVVAKPAPRVCRPWVSQILWGKLVAIADDQLSFTMNVKQTNRFARIYRGEDVTIQVNARTTVRLHGKRVALSALTVGDRLDVRARICRTDGALVQPLAVRVFAKHVKPAPTTTNTTTTTTTTT
jgi:hypothetical protein